MVMIKHELKQGWITLLIWTMVIALMMALCVLIYPEMETQMGDVSAVFAEMGGFSAAFGMDRLNFGEFMGFFGVECGNILGLGGAFFAALLGISVLAKEEKEQTELTRFGGKLLNGLSLSGRLQNMGWYRGSVQDAGGYYTFYREDGDLGVELEFSGCFVGDENEEVTVYGAQFYRAGTVKRGSYVYDTVKPENLYCLGEISPRYFSEIVLQLTKATASSKEKNVNWKATR